MSQIDLTAEEADKVDELSYYNSHRELELSSKKSSSGIIENARNVSR